jgi:hypothetical protein
MMPPEASHDLSDVDRTLEFAHTRAAAQQFFPYTFVGLLVGLFLMSPVGGVAGSARNPLLGAVIIALSLGMIALLAHRTRQPDIARIVLSRDGVLFRDLSERLIPWGAILEVDVTRVSKPGDLLSEEVTQLVVSKAFFRELKADRWLIPSVIARGGDASAIYISYFHTLPRETFHAAVLERWRAFGPQAEGVRQSDRFISTAPSRHVVPGLAAATPRGNSQSGSAPLPAIGDTFVALLKTASLRHRLVIGLACVGMAILFANHFGLWTTAGQIREREEAAKLEAWKRDIDASRKATEEERRRWQERMDRAFR